VFAGMVYLPFVWTTVVAIAAGKPAVLLMWLSFAFAPGLVRTVASRTDGPSLNRALAQSGRLLAAFSVLVSIGLLLS
jgi:1,4-dihydroxy-2-naphthoate octaprenyltransferase